MGPGRLPSARSLVLVDRGRRALAHGQLARARPAPFCASPRIRSSSGTRSPFRAPLPRLASPRGSARFGREDASHRLLQPTRCLSTPRCRSTSRARASEPACAASTAHRSLHRHPERSAPRSRRLAGSAEASSTGHLPRPEPEETVERRRTTIAGNPAPGESSSDVEPPASTGFTIAALDEGPCAAVQRTLAAALSTAREVGEPASDAPCHLPSTHAGTRPSAFSCRPEPLPSPSRQRRRVSRPRAPSIDECSRRSPPLTGSFAAAR